MVYNNYGIENYGIIEFSILKIINWNVKLKNKLLLFFILNLFYNINSKIKWFTLEFKPDGRSTSQFQKNSKRTGFIFFLVLLTHTTLQRNWPPLSFPFTWVAFSHTNPSLFSSSILSFLCKRYGGRSGTAIVSFCGGNGAEEKKKHRGFGADEESPVGIGKVWPWTEEQEEQSWGYQKTRAIYQTV